MDESAWICITAVAIVGILSTAFGMIILHLFKEPTLQYQPQLTQYQPPPREEVLIKLTEAGRLSEVTPLSIQNQKIIGYVTGEE